MKVGDPLYPGRSLSEGVAIDGSSGWLFVIALDGATHSEVEAVSRGRIDVAVGVGGDGSVMLWCIRTDTIGWSACAWAPWERARIERQHDGGQVVQVVLVDARSTRILALRSIGLSESVGRALQALEASCAATKRSDELLHIEREWSVTAEPGAVASIADDAPVRTWIEERRTP